MYRLASSTWGTEEIDKANELFKTGQLTMGAKVKHFESIFATYIGTDYGVMFNSGSSANLAIFSALKYVKNSSLREGDNVIVPAVSWSTTFYPITQNGYVLNFVDVGLGSLNLDVDKVEAAIDSKTKAIFAVNLLGNPANLIELKQLAQRHNLILLEDNCESLGASILSQRTGSFGLASSHSFFFSHHISTMEGGMVCTNSKELMETLVSLRAHGWTRGLESKNSVRSHSDDPWENLYTFVLPGYNLRPTELSAVIGIEQLKKFPSFLLNRKSNAEYFKMLFKDSENYQIQDENGESSWFGFSIILQKKLSGMRKEVVTILESNGVETRPIVAGNFTVNPVMKHLRHLPLPNLPIAHKIHSDGFFIGNHHFDTTKDLKFVYSLLKDFEDSIQPN